MHIRNAVEAGNTMKRISATAGDIILVPLAPSKFGATKVLFASKRNRHVILLGIYPIVISEVTLPSMLSRDYIPPLIYTGNQRVTLGIWPKVGNVPITDSERQLSLRVDANHVWLEDQYVREASLDDWGRLPVFEVWGCEAVEEHLRKILGA
jgi:hypothetical protein